MGSSCGSRYGSCSTIYNSSKMIKSSTNSSDSGCSLSVVVIMLVAWYKTNKKKHDSNRSPENTLSFLNGMIHLEIDSYIAGDIDR